MTTVNSNTSGVGSYLEILEALRKDNLMPGAVLYPACGVDILVANYARKLISINWFPYDLCDILRHLKPIVGEEHLRLLQADLSSKVELMARVNASNATLLMRALEKYEPETPKSLFVKGLFESLFMQEWDPDLERYYDVTPVAAKAVAEKWTKTIVGWLRAGDRVICLDDKMIPILDAQSSLVKRAELRPERKGAGVILRDGVPILYLSDEATVYERS